MRESRSFLFGAVDGARSSAYCLRPLACRSARVQPYAVAQSVSTLLVPLVAC
jgi:hypothetical protein